MKDRTKINPLVSIVVITYNSEEYVIETLESAKRQTYKNIQLIISDDCSTDNTIKICKLWIDNNRNHFCEVEVVESSINTKIPANCNRGLRAANGEWIKFIASDDILYDDCIENNIFYVMAHKDASFVFSDMECFTSSEHDTYCVSSILCDKQIFNGNPHTQYEHLVKYGLFFGVPSSFIRTQALKDIGYFDETILLGESYPTYIRATRNGYRLHYMQKFTVRYRIRNNSISNATVISKLFLDTIHKIIRKYRLPYLWWHYPILAYDIYVAMIVEARVYYNRHSWWRILLYTSPYFIYRKIFKKQGPSFSKYI